MGLARNTVLIGLNLLLIHIFLFGGKYRNQIHILLELLHVDYVVELETVALDEVEA